MEALSLYLWKSILVSGLLTGWYLLGLRGRRLHQYNRSFLLSVLFFSLTIPFLHFRLFHVPQFSTGRLAPVALLLQQGEGSNSLQVIQTVQQVKLSWQAIAGIAAVSISMVLLIILLVRVTLVRRMCRQQPAMQLSGINLVLTDSPKAPFAFLKYLFWKRSIPLNSEAGQLIFRHELIHIEQGHTYDKLVCQALTCIFWFNPFYWMIQKELSMVHEFIADEHAVGNSNTEAFAMMLLQSHNNGSYLAPQHHFFSSPVKRRLAMLQRGAKPSAVRRLMILPLLAGTVLLFSFGVSGSSVASHIVPAKKKVTVLLDAGHGGSDAGLGGSGYTEKEICLRYAKRIQELAPSYNVAVQLTRDNDRELPLAERVAIANKAKPDVFISLHAGDEPGKEKEKGDVDIYVSGTNAHAKESSNYSSAIFQAMAENGVIPGMPATGGSAHSNGCNCATCTNEAHRAQETRMLSTGKDGIYVLKNATVPAMIMIVGNINNKDEAQQLTNGDKMDRMCDAVLKGIVEGAEDKMPSNTVDLLLPPGKCR